MDIFFEDKRLNISPAYSTPWLRVWGLLFAEGFARVDLSSRQFIFSLPVINHIQISNRMIIERGSDWILDQKTKRIGFLGISFKAGTGHVRRAPS